MKLSSEEHADGSQSFLCVRVCKNQLELYHIRKSIFRNRRFLLSRHFYNTAFNTLSNENNEFYILELRNKETNVEKIPAYSHLKTQLMICEKKPEKIQDCRDSNPDITGTVL